MPSACPRRTPPSGINSHPADWTYANIETQAAVVPAATPTSFDWSRRLQTCDPSYYRWNQWLFLRFYERGLAYRRDGYVNWCPVDQTVLANEQVIAGRCERCGAEVVRRMLNQWYFKITEYADRLLADAAQLEGCWPDRVLLMQRNWIGRSEGAEVHFAIEGLPTSRSRSSRPGPTPCTGRRSSWWRRTRRSPSSCAPPTACPT